MKGYLYNILGDGVEELYWSEKEIENEILKTAYLWFDEEYEVHDWEHFEEFWNSRNEIKIERVFLEEVYI